MFVWLENGELKVAFQKELAPQNAIEIDTFGLNPIPPIEAFIKIENGQIIKKSEEEVLQWLKNSKLTELKSYVASLLERTDYVIVRIAEAEALGNTEAVEQLKQRYAKQLQQRQAIRRWNEQMKQAIRNAKTLEELRSIEIRYG
jgi:hypothetical protein